MRARKSFSDLPFIDRLMWGVILPLALMVISSFVGFSFFWLSVLIGWKVTPALTWSVFMTTSSMFVLFNMYNAAIIAVKHKDELGFDRL